MNRVIDRVNSDQFVLIAEIGVNYYDIAAAQGMELLDAAKLMCREAADAGVHAAKFQSYKAEALATRASKAYWDTSEEATRSQYELFRKYDLFGESEYGTLADYCASIGIEFLSTPFDLESADYLEPMMGIYKISSSDLTNLPFVKMIAKKGKPVMMSVGAGDLGEMRRAVDVVRSVNDQPLVLMHCVLEYPTPYAHANLSRISALIDEFPDLIIGYSDHTKPDQGSDVIKTAFTLGARVMEKHFTLDKELPGNDHYHAMDPEDAREILAGVQKINALLGSPELVFSETEEMARLNARRSIVANVLIPAGVPISYEMVTFKRPGTGISPTELESLLGRQLLADTPEDTTITWEMLA